MRFARTQPRNPNVVAPDGLRVAESRFPEVREQKLLVVDRFGHQTRGLFGRDHFILATRQDCRETCAHTAKKATPAELAHASSSARCWARRSANATIVSVGVAAAPVVNTALPAT